MGRVALPFNDLQNTIQKPLAGYRNTAITLGDKIRNKRLELQLLQKDVAPFIEATESAVAYWESNRYQPQIHSYLKVIEFLGYFPFDIDASTLGGKIKECRFKNGLSHKKIGKLLGVDGATICAWERNENIPLEKHLKKLLELLR